MIKPGRKRRATAPADFNDPRGFPVLIAAYLEHLRVRNYSPRTVLNCRVYLAYFTAWAAERGLTRPAEVTKPILERYQRWLYHYRSEKTGRALSFRTQHVRLTPIRTLFRYLARENFLLSNPASDLALPKLEKRLPKHVLTVSEVERVFSTVDLSHPLGVRDRAMLETLYSTGMRRSELAHLNVADLDPERGTLFIRQGKGQKDRMVPIGERALKWIEKYLRELRPALVVAPDPGTLFLANYGEAFGLSRLTQLAGDYVRGAGIGKTGACHLFRHTMATLMLEGGADIRFIQQMLGHVRLTSTEIYTQVSIRTLKAIHDATHPGARLRREAPNSPQPPTPVLSAVEGADLQPDVTDESDGDVAIANTVDPRTELLTRLAVEAAEDDER
jgi:integrase/recombinase XerD